MKLLSSTNVSLQLADDGPLRTVAHLYKDGNGLLAALRQCFSAWPRHAAPPAELLPLLHCVREYTAVDGFLGDETSTCGMFSSILSAIVRRAVELEACEEVSFCDTDSGNNIDDDDNNNNNNNNDDGDVVEEMPLTYRIITAASAAISNCCGGTTRHQADMMLCVRLQDTTMRVVFGFADYAEGETGARLWAGAVALSLYIIEQLDAILRPAGGTGGGRPLRIVELGCGPAVVSLVLATCILRRPELVTRAYIDVTDCSAAVVAEVRRSFARRNGPEIAVALQDDVCLQRGAVAVRAFCLDFTDIPAELCGQYDVVLGSDIVYDCAIASHVAPAIARLLRAGGVALVCCERHRDGMSSFVGNIQSMMGDSLEVVASHTDAGALLRQLQMIPGLTSTTCSLVVLRRR